MVVFNHPERRSEIVEVFRSILESMVDCLPKNEACDPTFAGLFISSLCDIKAKELSEEIKNVFATECVDEGVSGDVDSVLDDIQDPAYSVNEDRYKILDIYEEYKRFGLK